MSPTTASAPDNCTEAGKYVYIHVDGAMKPLLPYLRDCPWDAIEAATPLPQGDVTVEEIKQGLGDLILLDGIPALFFLPSFPLSDLTECCRHGRGPLLPAPGAGHL